MGEKSLHVSTPDRRIGSFQKGAQKGFGLFPVHHKPGGRGILGKGAAEESVKQRVWPLTAGQIGSAAEAVHVQAQFPGSGKGDGLVNSMIVENTKTGEQTEIVADEDDGIFGIFVFIGFKPATAVFEGKVNMERGYIVTDQEMRTNVPGVYAAGDCRVKDLRQVVTAAADGAIAAWQAARYIDEMN